MPQIFDLYDIFVNEVAGSIPIFLALSLVVIVFFCSIFKFTNQMTIGIVVTYILIISAFISPLLAITLFIIAIFVAWQIHKISK